MRPEHQVTVFFLPVAAAPEKGILLYPAVDGSVQMAEAIGEPPRLELFARRRRLGWEAWGDEVGKSC